MQPVGDDRIKIGHQRDRDRRGNDIAENGREAAQQAGAEARDDGEGQADIDCEVEKIDRQLGFNWFMRGPRTAGESELAGERRIVKLPRG